MKASILLAWVAATAFWSLSTVASAQAAEPRVMPPSVTVTGEGTVVAESELAEIDIGVTTQSKSAVEAAGANAEKLTKVVAEIKKLLGPGDDLKTAGYSLTPNYKYSREGGKPEIVGYTASNVVRVKTVRLASVGKLIDAVTRSGANDVQRLTFKLKDEEAARQRALHGATVKAKSKADEVARALGLKIVKVLSVTEADRSVRPMIPEGMALRAELGSSQTPVEPGTIEIRSMVTLTAELGN